MIDELENQYYAHKQKKGMTVRDTIRILLAGFVLFWINAPLLVPRELGDYWYLFGGYLIMDTSVWLLQKARGILYVI